MILQLHLGGTNCCTLYLHEFDEKGVSIYQSQYSHRVEKDNEIDVISITLFAMIIRESVFTSDITA